MKYPQKSPYLIYKGMSEGRHKIEDFLYDEIWLLDPMEMAILRSLDGRHNPDHLPPECGRDYVHKTLEEFRDNHLLAPEKKIEFHGIGSCTIPLVYCYPGKCIRFFARVCNNLLMTLFIPVFLLGGYFSKTAISDVYIQSKGELIAAILIGSFVGIAMHELAHAFAALAYGGNVFEIGAGVSCFLPMGYVLMNYDNVKNRMKRIQIHFAGIEMNLFLSGIFMLLKHHFIYMILVNLIMAVINILPLDGQDGLNILSALFNKDNLLKDAKCLIRDFWYGKTPRSIRSFTAVVASCCLAGFQVVLPLLAVIEGYSIVKLVLWFVF